MKRLAITLLATVNLPACAGEITGNSSDGGASADHEQVRVATKDGGAALSDDLPTSERGTGLGSTTASATTASLGTSTTAMAGSSLGGVTSAGSLTAGFTGQNTSRDATSSNPVSDQTDTGNDATAGDTVWPDTAADQSETDASGQGVSDSDAESSSEHSDQDASSEQTSDTSADPMAPAFDIDLVYLDESTASPAVLESFERAEAFWEQLIVGDLPDVTTRRQACNGPDIYVEGTIDDLQIFVAVGIMDGPDGVLGAAGPCLGRATWQGGLPLAGFMQFDSEDLERYAQQGRLDEVIIHEMGHVLGFGGVLWQEMGYLADPSDEGAVRDTHFTGEKAIAAFDAIGGNAYSDAKVPVENTGGPGTANGHWREAVMGNEMMTSYMTNLEAVLSTVTLGALEDMGYQVDYSKAGGYEWPPPDERSNLFSLRTEPALPPIDFGNDILDLPFATVE